MDAKLARKFGTRVPLKTESLWGSKHIRSAPMVRTPGRGRVPSAPSRRRPRGASRGRSSTSVGAARIGCGRRREAAPGRAAAAPGARARTGARTAPTAASARKPTQSKAPASPGRIGPQGGESTALAEERNSHGATPGASGVQARTAGELRVAGEVVLPPVQMELFAEAGAIVAERAVAAGARREVVVGILRRAAEHAGAVAPTSTG